VGSIVGNVLLFTGEIEECRIRLKELLGDNFSGYADRFASMDPMCENYRNCEELPEYFSRGPAEDAGIRDVLFRPAGSKTSSKNRVWISVFSVTSFPVINMVSRRC